MDLIGRKQTMTLGFAIWAGSFTTFFEDSEIDH